MALALLALSLVMIVGGIASVVQGFPYVRLESGLAMVIGGATAASAGTILVGLAAAVAQLKRVEARLGGMSGQSLAEAGLLNAAPAPVSAAFRAPAFEEPPPLATEPRPRLAGAAGLAGVTLGAAGGLDEAAPGPHGGRRFEREPPLPDLLPPTGDPPLGGPPADAEEELFAAPDAAGRPASGPDPAQVELALRSTLDEPAEKAEPAGKTPPPSPEPDARKEEPQVVGTYASGGNTYVMFSNGTVEAQTPQGRYSFQSLEELKQFVEAGGESPARGAA